MNQKILKLLLPECDSFLDHWSLGKVLTRQTVLRGQTAAAVARGAHVTGVHQDRLRLHGGNRAALISEKIFFTKLLTKKAC